MDPVTINQSITQRHIGGHNALVGIFTDTPCTWPSVISVFNPKTVFVTGAFKACSRGRGVRGGLAPPPPTRNVGASYTVRSV